jgi:hypothetical protein
MSKDDINSLGSVYGGMLNGLKKDLIKEGKVGPGEIGDADLLDGGPTEEGGFTAAAVDVEKLSDKEKEDNLYNIDKLSYTNSYMPEEDEEGKYDDKDDKKEKCDYVDCEEDKEDEEDAEEVSVKQEVLNAVKQGAGEFAHKNAGMLQSAKELHDQYSTEGDQERASITKSLVNYFTTQLKFDENEESSEITEKIAQDGLNNFMKQKSVFDKLYDKVMVNENFDEMESEDLDALGLDDATPDADSDEVTVTLSRDVAQALCDVLQAACGESDSEDADEAPEGAFGEEDEEGIDTGSTHSGKYDDGKSNKVGDLKTAAAASAKGADSKLDAGSHLNTSYDDGKSNKVGSLKTGDRAVD